MLTEPQRKMLQMFYEGKEAYQALYGWRGGHAVLRALEGRKLVEVHVVGMNVGLHKITAAGCAALSDH